MSKYLNSIGLIGEELEKKEIEENEVEYISKVIQTESFNKLIVSWNIETPKETWVKVEARVYVDIGDDGEWSSWLSWGKWGINIKRACDSFECKLAKVDIDTLIVKDKKSASKIQVRIKAYNDNKEVEPIIRQVSLTYLNNNVKLCNKSISNIDINKFIETPCISQMLREKSIAHKICSPTSITMLLNRMGEKLIVEDVAKKCFDYKYDGFGNWVFNVAFAGSLGYEAYIEFGGLDALKREIYSGYPFAASVKYSNDIENKEYPYIENAPITTSGHLIVVCGVEKDNDNEWIIVNDPAGKDNESVRLKYKLQEFMKAWETSNCIMYIIHGKRNVIK